MGWEADELDEPANESSVAHLQERVDFVSHVIGIPLKTTANFCLFQYLLIIYYRRRREKRVMLMIACALLSFMAVVPSEYPDALVLDGLEDMSKSCTTLTFLLQISVLGRDVHRKFRLRSLRRFTLAAEWFTAFGIALILTFIVQIIHPMGELTEEGDETEVTEMFDTIADIWISCMLVFIAVFRFYYLAMANGGFKRIWRLRKPEMVSYFLFTTYNVPFLILEEVTEADWEHLEALWFRLTIVLCTFHTVHSKLKTSNLSNPSASGPQGNSRRTDESRHGGKHHLPALRRKNTNNAGRLRSRSILRRPRVLFEILLRSRNTRQTSERYVIQDSHSDKKFDQETTDVALDFTPDSSKTARPNGRSSTRNTKVACLPEHTDF